MTQQLFRPSPAGPMGAYQTFALARPRTPAYWRNATCDDVDCERKRNGWRSVVDTATADGARWARWFVEQSGRHGTREESGTVVTFTFHAGQNCFEKHKVLIEREPLYIVRDGDHRGNPTGRKRVHTRGADWMDHMHTDVDKVLGDRNKG